MGNCSSKKANMKSKRPKWSDAASTVKYQQPSPIFKLNAICCDDLFEWLSIKDLDSLGQTCRRMHRLTGLYFQENCKKTPIRCYNKEILYNDNVKLSGLIPYVQSVEFDARCKKKDFKSIADCDSLREIGLCNVKLDTAVLNYIKEKLDQIETISFWSSSSEIQFYADFLKLCPNLKKLCYKHCVPMESDWMCHEYPKIEHISLSRLNHTSSEHLKIFLKKNPHLQRFDTCQENLLEHRGIFINSNLKLDVLQIFLSNNTSAWGDTFSLVNRLYDDQFYKRLECIIHHQEVIDQIGTLCGLEKLIISFQVPIVWPKIITSLKKLIYCYGDRNIDALEAMTVSFPNLQKVHLAEISTIDQLLPFIRRLPKLKELSVSQCHPIGFEIDILTLNEERKKLAGTCKVIIYLSEDAYLATKMAPKNLYIKHELIDIKRIYSQADKQIWLGSL